jgi:hypothetical protein
LWAHQAAKETFCAEDPLEVFSLFSGLPMAAFNGLSPVWYNNACEYHDCDKGDDDKIHIF